MKIDAANSMSCASLAKFIKTTNRKLGSWIEILVDKIGTFWSVIISSLIVVVFTFFSAVAIVQTIAGNNLVLGQITAILTPVVHFASTFIGLQFVEGFVRYPVEPKKLFWSVDVTYWLILGGSVGITSSFFVLFANFVLIIANSAIIYRNYIIYREISAAGTTRNQTTDSLAS